MVAVKIDSRGLVQEKAGVSDSTLTVTTPITFTGTSPVTVNSGSFTISNGASIFTKVSSSLASSKPDTSGLLFVGGVPPTTLLQNVLVTLSASANQSGMNAIMFFATGSGTGGGQGNGQGGRVNGSGGAIGIHASPPASALTLFTDGVRFYAKNSAGTQFTLLATSSTGITM